MARRSSLPGGVEDLEFMQVMAKMSSLATLPMALATAINLQVMDILARETPSQLSAQEIVAFIAQTKGGGESSIPNPTAHIALDRILRVLASQELLSSSLQDQAHGQPPVKKYGLTAASRYLARGVDPSAPSFAHLALLCVHEAMTATWPFLEKSVLEGGGDAFTLAHGYNIFHFGKAHLQFGNLFNAAMANDSLTLNPFLLESYDGFLGVQTLVDVGGGIGASLYVIVSKYPHIKAINFDKPHVVASAPSYPGVEHIGGDMFESIPQGDAIFLKCVLHNWTDDLCIKILTNCYKAMPTNGKVIIVDAMLSVEVGKTSRAITNNNADLIMYTVTSGGKERTEKEFQEIALASGFKKLQIISQVNDYFVIELHKVV